MKTFAYKIVEKGFLLLLLCYFQLANAQAPQKMSYQAVIRDAGNILVSNTTVGIKISILQGNPTGTVVYSETHSVITNVNGLASLEIGGGSVESGNFTTINWANGPYFIKTETDPLGGTNYTISGTSQVLSVPYALLSDKAVNPTYPISVSDDSTTFLLQTLRNTWVDDPDISVIVPETGKYLLIFSGGATNVNSYAASAVNYDRDCSVRVFGSGIGELSRAIVLQSYVEGTASRCMPMNPNKSVVVNLTQGSVLKLQYMQISGGSPSTSWYIGNDNVFMKASISIMKIGN